MYIVCNESYLIDVLFNLTTVIHHDSLQMFKGFRSILSWNYQVHNIEYAPSECLNDFSHLVSAAVALETGSSFDEISTAYL